MRSNFLAILIAITAAMSCTKRIETIVVTPPRVDTIPTSKATFTKNTALSNGTILVPRGDTVLSSGIFDVKSDKGLTVIGANVEFTSTGAFAPADDLQNIYFILKDGDSVVYTSTPKATVANGSTSFDQMLKSLTPTKIYTSELHATIKSSAADTVGVPDQCTIKFGLTYQTNGVGTDERRQYDGQTMTFALKPTPAVSSITTAIDPTNPVGSVVLEGNEKAALIYTLTALGSSAGITEQVFKIQGVGATAVNSLKLFDGTMQIANVPVINGVATISPGTIALVQNTTKTFVVRVVIGGVVATTSSETFTVTLDRVRYQSVPAFENKVEETDRVGNMFTILKSSQSVNSVSLSGGGPGLLLNNFMAAIYQHTVSSAITGQTANKQFAYDIVLTDNGTHIDALSIKNLAFMVDGVVVSNVRFTNSAGKVIDSVGPADPRVYVTFISGAHEHKIPAGSTSTFTLGGMFSGFLHPQDGDNVSIKLVVADQQTSYRIVNSGIAPTNNNAKLFNVQPGNTAAVVYKYIWSDYSDPAHVFVFGSGTPDAKNGFVGIEGVINAQVWTQ